jgi:hypothetical protein
MTFENLIDKERMNSFIYLKYFIEKDILKRKDIRDSKYFNELKLSCKNILEKLEKKEINFSQVQKLNELINNNKLADRIKCLCLGDSIKANEIFENIKDNIKKYNKYYSELAKIIRYYNTYFPKSKESDINKYKKVQEDFNEAKINICNIIINEKIYEEIKNFEDYEKSKFFQIFYNNIVRNSINNDEDSIEKKEIEQYEKSKEIFNRCKKLFNGENLEISFLKDLLSNFNDDGKCLLKEIIYLKKYFNQNKADEKKITEDLNFYKHKKNISLSLQSL